MANGESMAAMESRLKLILEETHQAFLGEYKDEINALLGLSREEIDEITPDATDLETYDKLIVVVKDASAQNLKQAQLKENILQLGATAISIARKVPSLATLLA